MCSIAWGNEKIVVEEPHSKRPFGSSTHRWDDSIKIRLWEIEYNIVNWIKLPQDRAQWWTLLLLKFLDQQNNYQLLEDLCTM
jgi:hypothetical protein